MRSSKKTQTWSDYKNFVQKMISDNHSYVFRGQRDPSWPLQTSFHRSAKELKISLEQYLDTIIPEIHYYISAAKDEILDLSKPEEFGSFLALLQHHGFPTPILDWTHSPYIGAYFAFRDVDEKTPQSDNVKIFIFDFIEWTKTYQQPLNLREFKGQYISFFRPMAKFNPRLLHQMGAFTVTNVEDMEQYFLDMGKKAKKTFLYSFELSVKEKPAVMRELHLMSINEMSLFPGVDGICRTLKEIHFSKNSVGLTPSEIQQIMNFWTSKFKKS